MVAGVYLLYNMTVAASFKGNMERGHTSFIHVHCTYKYYTDRTFSDHLISESVDHVTEGTLLKLN
jgi:predicted DNA-binding protein with PD1-like motif